jgi:hypothetical protein
MVRGLVAALGLISVLAALIFVALLMVNQLGSLSGGLAGNAPSGGAAGSVVLRISGTPGVRFSGNYATPQGSKNFSGTLGPAPTDYKLGGEGVGSFNLVTVNVQKLGMGGTLKVEILKNGQVVQSGETTATNSTVSVTYTS